MSARFEVVRTDAGWHARFVAANQQYVWTTETYVRKAGALNAVNVITGATTYTTPHNVHREVMWHGDREKPTEVRVVDERKGATR